MSSTRYTNLISSKYSDFLLSFVYFVFGFNRFCACQRLWCILQIFVKRNSDANPMRINKFCGKFVVVVVVVVVLCRCVAVSVVFFSCIAELVLRKKHPLIEKLNTNVPLVSYSCSLQVDFQSF